MKKNTTGNNKAFELISLFIKAAGLIEEKQSKFYERSGLTPIQFSALLLLQLSNDREMTLSNLSEKLNVSRPDVTALADRMESKGLVRRIPNSADRRSIKVAITEEAEKIIQKFYPRNIKFNSSLLDFLTEEEQESLYHLTLKVIDEIQKPV